MRIPSLSWAVIALLAPVLAHAQPVFVDVSAQLEGTTNSGGCVGVVDMNGDGLDDVATLHNSRTLIVHYQNPDGEFVRMNYGTVANADQWGMSFGDLSNSGHKDLVSGGSYDGVRQLSITAPGQASQSSLNNGTMFMQCNNMADIDNDGWADFFACHDDAEPRIWLNEGDGTLSYAEVMDFTTDPGSDGSGNYGSVWTDFDNDGDLDLYIAKCRQGVNNPDDPRRWNRLFVNDGNGNFTDLAEERGIQVRNQSWTADFADIDNDGDMDLVITNHDATIQLFENDGNGYFTEITAGSGLEITGFFLQSKMADFDNDGFVDLIVTGGVHRYFRNNGDKTFTMFENVFPAGKQMRSLSVGDLNNDGFLDVFAAYGNGYVSPDPNFSDRLWMNTPNDNNWLGVRLTGVESNRDAIGARVTIYGPWGIQIREVRAGESYGIVTTFMAHFGLGNETEVDSMVVSWPSGTVDTYTDIPGGQMVNVVEGTCISPVASISIDGPPVICTGGEPLLLTATEAAGYTWNTGATTQAISVTDGGYYQVTIDDGAGCVSTAAWFITADPDETPTISVSGETVFCEGGSVVLTSSSAQGYSWSNDETTQQIEVSTSGSYSVTIDGTCAEATSQTVEVLVLDAPDAPAAEDVDLDGPGPADLSAEGDGILWFDVPEGGTPVGEGNTWTTPELFTTTSFWAQGTTVHGGGVVSGAKEDLGEPGAHHTNAGFYLRFEANEPFTIRSVKVFANGAGNRPIALVDGNGNTLVEGVFSIPDGESRVDLDFEVPEAGIYGLRVVSGNPQLWRDGIGSDQNYPYPLGDLGAIIGTNVTGQNALALYYFFYDWEVEPTSYACTGPRTEVVVNLLGTGLEEGVAGDGPAVWPNPVKDQLMVRIGADAGDNTVLELFDISGRSVMLKQVGRQATGAGVITLDVSDLAAGEYLLQARSEGAQWARRVVVH